MNSYTEIIFVIHEYKTFRHRSFIFREPKPIVSNLNITLTRKNIFYKKNNERIAIISHLKSSQNHPKKTQYLSKFIKNETSHFNSTTTETHISHSTTPK